MEIISQHGPGRLRLTAVLDYPLRHILSSGVLILVLLVVILVFQRRLQILLLMPFHLLTVLGIFESKPLTPLVMILRILQTER